MRKIRTKINCFYSKDKDNLILSSGNFFGLSVGLKRIFPDPDNFQYLFLLLLGVLKYSLITLSFYQIKFKILYLN